MSREDCHCCEPAAAPTPVSLYNRPGLSAVAYRVGTFAQFRQAMLQGIARLPELRALSTRESDDYAVTLLELWAAVGDVLSFYQERTANEAFLRTATRRGSVQRLAGLLGYRLAPGLAATAWLSFTIQARKQLAVPVGLRVQSVPGQDEKPQKFETLEAFVAHGWLNRLTAYAAPEGVNPLAPGNSSAWLAPEDDGLEALEALAADDRLLLFDLTSPPEELVVKTLESVGEQLRLEWTRPIQGAGWDAATRVYKRGRSFKLFGYNAPFEYAKPTQSSWLVLWNLTTIGTATPGDDNFALGTGDTLYLDSRHPGLEVGARLLLVVGGGQQKLFTVIETGEVDQTLGPITDTVTYLKLDASFAQVDDRRRVVVHELLGEPVRFWGYRYPETIDASPIYIPGRRQGAGRILLGREPEKQGYSSGEEGAPEALEKGRGLLLTAAGAEPVAAVVTGAAVTEREVRVEATADDPTSAAQLKLDAGSAERVDGLCSATLTPFPTLNSGTPVLRLRVDDQGPFTLTLAVKPITLAQAAQQLQGVIRALSTDDHRFTEARVLGLEDRLVVLAGGADVTLGFEPGDNDRTTVRELGLESQQVRPVTALVSGPLGVPPLLVSGSPRLAVSMGPVGSRGLSLTPPYADLDALAEELQALLHNVDMAPLFAFASVAAREGRLLIIPGRLGRWPRAWLRVDLQAVGSFTFAGRLDLLGNVALASHGETVKEETLGDGDPGVPFQKFTLKKAPLTHVPSASSSAGKSSLDLRVERMPWQEVESLYGRAPTETVYVSRIDDEGKSRVRFGDGENGARPSAGRGNIVARYRQGLGLDGRVAAHSLSNPLDRPKGLQGVDNPAAAEGGADPEALEQARDNAPATVRTFGRAVSLRDFEELLKAGGEVAKARATWVWAAGRRTAHLTVGGQEGGRFSAAALGRLHAGLTAQRDPNRPLLLDNYLPLPVLVGATLMVEGTRVASEVLETARAALLEAISFSAQPFGRPLHLSDIHALLQGVTGVTAVDVDRLMFKHPQTMNETQFQAFLDQRGVERLGDGRPRPLQQHLRIYPARPAGGAPPWVRSAEQAYIEVPGEDLSLLTSGGLPD